MAGRPRWMGGSGGLPHLAPPRDGSGDENEPDGTERGNVKGGPHRYTPLALRPNPAAASARGPRAGS